MTIIEMRVHMDCAGCESKIRKYLQRVKGVDDIDIDMALQKVTVTGWADQKKVLKTVRRTGKRAELWQFGYNPETRNHNYTGHHNYYQNNAAGAVCPSSTNYYTPQQPSASSYNYYKHGYDNNNMMNRYNSGSNSSIFGNRTGDNFSDENPNGCSVM